MIKNGVCLRTEILNTEMKGILNNISFFMKGKSQTILQQNGFTRYLI